MSNGRIGLRNAGAEEFLQLLQYLAHHDNAIDLRRYEVSNSKPVALVELPKMSQENLIDWTLMKTRQYSQLANLTQGDSGQGAEVDLDFRSKLSEGLQKYDDTIEEIKRVRPYETPLVIELLDFQQALNLIYDEPPFSLTLPTDVTVGTLPTGKFGAVTLKAPNGGYIIVVDAGTMIAIDKLMRGIVALIPFWLEDNRWLYSLEPERLNAHRKSLGLGRNALVFYEALIAQSLFKSPAASFRGDLNEARDSFASALTETAEFFIFAHEYAHLALGHFDNPRRFFVPSLPEYQADTTTMDRLLEADADYLAFNATLAYMGEAGMDSAGIFVGIDVLLSILAESAKPALRSYVADRIEKSNRIENKGLVMRLKESGGIGFEPNLSENNPGFLISDRRDFLKSIMSRASTKRVDVAPKVESMLRIASDYENLISSLFAVNPYNAMSFARALFLVDLELKDAKSAEEPSSGNGA